ncbi:nucleoside hydrolase [uncultured Thermanaerothrix sp.]|uniref:nucleoside hydrolase n=1 Tax=uncultured Thermanaerothrix sp. TaxID=1195149 RepID=UPI002618D986|nr:nucleoside hydrolase [uncultured Thermanaerothrix sp.]
MKKRVLLDVDTGHDDAVAIMLACASDSLDVCGITTVAGNQTVDKTLENTLRVLTLIGEERVPVARGFHKPLVRDLVTAHEIHGESGLDGATLPSPRIVPLQIHAVNFIIDVVRSAAGNITIIPTGPLTNIAVALLMAPDIAEKIARIVLMGGSICGGNRTPVAEFNIFVDPEAAAIVFGAGVPITMVGLDVTMKAVFDDHDIMQLSRMKGPVSGPLAALLTFFAERHEKLRGIRAAVLHDALAVAGVIKEDLLVTKSYPVRVETKGELTRGMTVVDRRRGVIEQAGDVEVAVDADIPCFKSMVMEAIARLDARMAG